MEKNGGCAITGLETILDRQVVILENQLQRINNEVPESCSIIAATVQSALRHRRSRQINPSNGWEKAINGLP
jgi:hypothetical protein